MSIRVNFDSLRPMKLLENLEIRAAKPSEADELSALALRSKSHWPYDAEYLNLCKITTRISPQEILQWPVLVAAQGPQICGVAVILEAKGERLLEHLWIDPPFIGKGIGRELFYAAVAEGKKLGWSQFHIFSDPYARGFYEKLGARQFGERESKVRPGFFLPMLNYQFDSLS